MRLLNTKSYEVKEILQHEPRYAILSHRWGMEEITFEQLKNRSLMNDQGQIKEGWEKITRFCEMAASLSLEWAWVDTCLIDKSSSAELSEAINSMYGWYKNADICLVYMNDLLRSEPETFEKSEWFTRGWTLQELLAPRQVLFFDRYWRRLGSRKELCGPISLSTRIPSPLLFHPTRYRIEWCSIAERMLWASKRMTTRPEDLAYCLLGLFDVQMPLLYGEGARNAFYRLQIAIMEKSEDESIFAWASLGILEHDGSMLAEEPRDFHLRGVVKQDSTNKRGVAHSMTNQGLRIQLDLCEVTQSVLLSRHLRDSNRHNADEFAPSIKLGFPRRLEQHASDTLLVPGSESRFVAPLKCFKGESRLFVVLEKVEHAENEYNRLHVSTLEEEGDLPPGQLTEVLVRPRTLGSRYEYEARSNGVALQLRDLGNSLRRKIFE